MKDFLSELRRRNVVRVAVAYGVVAWVLAQAADLLFGTFGAPEGFLKGFYIILGLGFPLALFFSWAFEITPEGVKKTREVDKSQSITHGTGQKINRLIAVGLVLALGFIVYDKFLSGDRPVHQAEAANTSIAVLPFINMSSDPEQDYFSDGISEELLNLLAKIPELQVAGRTSSFAFKGKNQDLREIGETLGVSFLLEGSVRKQGDRVRITAQLIRASDGIHLWSETYDRTLDDVFAIQDDISGAIVRELQVRILGGETPPVVKTQKVDPEAHSLYLLGLQRHNMDASQPYLDARNYYRRALEISPDYLDALWGLGLVAADLAGFGTIENDQAEAEIEDVLTRVRALGAGDDPLVLLLESYLFHLDGDHAKEGPLALEAYAKNPNHPKIIEEASNAFSRINDDAKALEVLQKGLARDPLNLALLRILSRVQGSLGDDSASEATTRKILEIDPTYSEGWSELAFINLRKGQWAEAQKNLDKVRELDPIDPDIPVVQANFLIYAGFLDEAENLLNEADAMSPNEVYSIATRAYLLAAKGDYNTAGIMAESLLLGDRQGRLGSDSTAVIAAEYAFSKTGQFERLKNLILAHEPNLERSPENFRQEGDSVSTLNEMIGMSDELARALMGLGQEDEAKALLEAAIRTYKDINPEGDLGNIFPKLILLGRYDEVVDYLSEPGNLRIALRVKYEPIISWRAEPLKDHPGFQALMADIEAQYGGEIEKIRAWLDTQKTE